MSKEGTACRRLFLDHMSGEVYNTVIPKRKDEIDFFLHFLWIKLVNLPIPGKNYLTYEVLLNIIFLCITKMLQNNKYYIMLKLRKKHCLYKNNIIKNARNIGVMRTRKLPVNRKKIERKKKRNPSVHGVVSLTICGLTVIALSVGCRIAGREEKNEVYAASEPVFHTVDYDLPTGIAGVASGISAAPEEGSTIYRIGTSCEHVVVGQRIQKVEKTARELNVSASMEAAVEDLDSKAVLLASSATMMSDTDYQNLLHIVEAEAGTEDVKGRVLIANVIMNRVKHPEFPDTVSEVIWEYDNGVAQFSPIADGRIGEVTVSDETREAVKQALEGVDYSEGALFFIQKSAAEKHNIDWFEKDLKWLFKHGVHEFYTYPDEVSGNEEENDSNTQETEDLVQMVETDAKE